MIERQKPSEAGLLEERDGLWEVGTAGIIGRRDGIVKARRRQNIVLRCIFTPPVPICELGLVQRNAILYTIHRNPLSRWTRPPGMGVSDRTP